VTLETTMTVLSTRAGIHHVDTIATMAGNLLHDIMATVNDKVFVFHHATPWVVLRRGWTMALHF
jgi:hypothetical protein